MQRLVIGCLAFSAIALVFLFVSAGDRRNYFHGPTKAMNDAISGPGTVLAADRSGAVTQTGNGRVGGYRRSSDQRLWQTDFSRFESGPENPFGAGAIDASAWCAGACPAAIVSVLGDYTAHGGAGGKLAAALDTLGRGGDALLRVTAKDSAFVRASPGSADEPQLIWLVGSHGGGAGVANPSSVEIDGAATRAVSGASQGASGTLTPLTRRGSKWTPTGETLRQPGLKNACVSADGAWVGAVGTRARMFAFGSASGTVVGPTLASGTCSVDPKGITLSYTTPAGPALLAARYSLTGRRIWTHLFGAQTLLSRGGSPNVVAQAADGTVTVLDAVSGRTIARQQLVGRPYVGDDGSVVHADREGRPSWIVTGRAPQ